MVIRTANVMEVADVHWNIIRRGWIVSILTLAMLIILLSLPVHAFTLMTDEELSQVTGTGFSSFTLENDVAKASFNIEARTFTEIQSLKMGYYNDGTSLGWDEDWTNVSLGSATEDLVCKGLYIEAKFTNLSDPATRTLDYIKVGTPSMTGPISATFNSFSGHIENPTDGVLVDGRRLNLGQKTITSTNSEFYLQLSRTGAQAGWWVYWNNATIN
jgi:hypothetical protein